MGDLCNGGGFECGIKGNGKFCFMVMDTIEGRSLTCLWPFSFLCEFKSRLHFNKILLCISYCISKVKLNTFISSCCIDAKKKTNCCVSNNAKTTECSFQRKNAKDASKQGDGKWRTSCIARFR